jgi:hypothetical protein
VLRGPGLALAGLPLWADVSGLRGLPYPLLDRENARGDRPGSPHDDCAYRLITAAGGSNDSTTPGAGGRCDAFPFVGDYDAHEQRRSPFGGAHAGMPQSTALFGVDSASPHASSPTSTARTPTSPRIPASPHDDGHPGGVVGGSDGASDEHHRGALHRLRGQHRDMAARGPMRTSTVLLPRALMSPAAARGQPADYIMFDGSPAVRTRARLRLCSTLLDDHLELRHQLDGASARRLAMRCGLCGDAGSRRTVDHVYLRCAHPPLAAARTAAAVALRAIAMDLDLRALAGVADGDDDRRAAAIRATAGLLSIVRSLLVI